MNITWGKSCTCLTQVSLKRLQLDKSRKRDGWFHCILEAQVSKTEQKVWLSLAKVRAPRAAEHAGDGAQLDWLVPSSDINTPMRVRINDNVDSS